MALTLALALVSTPVNAEEQEVKTEEESTIDFSEVEFANPFRMCEVEWSVMSNLGCIMTAKYEEETVYTTDAVNVRTIPTESQTPVSVLEPNTELTRVGLGSFDKWDIIQVNGKLYFVSHEYLTTDEPEEVIVIDELPKIPTPRKNSGWIPAPPSTHTPSDAPKNDPQPGKQGRYLGRFRLTAYCPCARCCGKSNGITASGTVATAGRTVACNTLPFGTRIIINGHTYVVEDRGGMKGNAVDIFFDSHQAALNFGVGYADVYLAQ